MNRFLCAASLLAMIIPSAALAQQDDKHHGNGGGQHAARPSNGGGQHAARPAGRPAQAQPARNRPGRPSGERPQAGPSQTTMHARPSRAAARPGTGERPAVQPSSSRPRPGVRPQNFHPVRAPAFRYPSGYHYRRWSIGLVLPSIFLTNYYFYSGWAALGAYPPPPGFVWVRYGPDLLLVGRHSGRIRDVIYGAFY